MTIVKDPPSTSHKTRHPKALTKPANNPHIDVDAPKTVHCPLGGSVVFDNHGPHDHLVTFSNEAIFGCTDVLVKPDGVALQVQDRGSTQYITRPARHLFALQACAVSTIVNSQTTIGPKDIIVP